MNALNMARTAYSSAAAPTRTNQGTEYKAFAQITSSIKSASAKGKSGFPELATALHNNRRLWLLLAADVADAGNQLPDMLRAQIMYLSEFTQIHTGKILNGQVNAEALIDINLAVMRGLRQQEANK